MQGLVSFLLFALPLIADAAPSIVGQGSASTGYGALHVARLQRVKRDRMLGKRACQVKPNAVTNGVLVAPSASSTQPAVSTVVSSAAPAPATSAAPAPQAVAAPAPAPAAAAPAPAPAPAANGSHKQKCGWGSNNPSWVNSWLFTGASWVYNWSPWPTQVYQQMGLEFIPMFWGDKQISDFYTNLPNYPSYNVQHVLFLNEPDMSGQSNLSPSAAAALYWQHMAPIAGQYKIIAPALTSSPGSIGWLQQFMPMINYGVSAMALHWYGTSSADFIAYVTNFHNTFGMNIWVTEFACADLSNYGGCAEDSNYFMQTVTGWMDSQSFVERYAAFGALVDMSGVSESARLLNADGQSLTAVGHTYFQT